MLDNGFFTEKCAKFVKKANQNCYIGKQKNYNYG